MDLEGRRRQRPPAHTAYDGKMGRDGWLGVIGGIAAVALVAHLWMLPAFDGSSTPLHVQDHPQATASVAAATDTPPTSACPLGMSACVATGAQELQLLLVVAICTLPALLWVLRRRPSTTRSTGSSRHGPEPPLSPVDKRVLLLE